MYLAARSRASVEGCVIPNTSMKTNARYRKSLMGIRPFRPTPSSGLVLARTVGYSD